MRISYNVYSGVLYTQLCHELCKMWHGNIRTQYTQYTCIVLYSSTIQDVTRQYTYTIYVCCLDVTWRYTINAILRRILHPVCVYCTPYIVPRYNIRNCTRCDVTTYNICYPTAYDFCYSYVVEQSIHIYLLAGPIHMHTFTCRWLCTNWGPKECRISSQ